MVVVAEEEEEEEEEEDNVALFDAEIFLLVLLSTMKWRLGVDLRAALVASCLRDGLVDLRLDMRSAVVMLGS